MCGNESGPIFISIIGAMSIVAATTDLAKGKIYNWLTLPAMAVGLIVGFVSAGFPGLSCSFLGLVAGFFLYGWMYLFLRAMGAGDVKLLMAFGAWGGGRYALHVAILGVFLGAISAVFSLLAKGKLQAFVRKMVRFVLSVFVKELDLELPKLDRSLTLPFGVPLASAAVWVAISNPFLRWRLGI